VIPLFTGLDDIGWSDRNVDTARCAGGICVYSSSLKNPTTAPQDQLRGSVVSGQIERNGSIFQMVVDKKFPEVYERLDQVSEFLRAYGSNLRLTLVVDETLASTVLEAYLFISSDPSDQHMEMRFPSQRYQPRTLPNCVEELRMIGPATIREKILGLQPLYPCRQRTLSMSTFSVYENGLVPWTGTCFSAK